MIYDNEQEVLSQRKNKLNILLNKTAKRALCFKQHKIIKQVLEPPKRIFSYSRSIRHFQEIMSKTGSVSLNKKAITLFMRREESLQRKTKDEFAKLTNSKLIQTDDFIQDEYGFKTDRLSGLQRESPYIRKRKFSQHLNINDHDNYPKQPYLQHMLEIQQSISPRTGKKIREQTFQNEVLQKRVPKLISNHFRTTNNAFTSRKQRQLDNSKIDTIFTTITHRY